MPVIYIDVLVMLNLWVDFLLLSATARLRRMTVKGRRLLLGAACGAVGSCLLFLPPLSVWVALCIRVVGTVLLTRIAFPFTGWRRFFGDLLTFAVLCAVFAGGATMLWYFVSPAGFWVINGVVYYDAPAALLIVFTALSYGAVCLFDLLTRRKIPRGGKYTLVLRHRGKEVVCSCLYDTGCTLKEPFSGKPAAVIDALAVDGLLPADWQTAGAAVQEKIRFVPFKSLNGEGLLPAFQPEYMALSDDSGKRRDITGSYLALSEQLGNSEYTALVGTDIGDLLTEGS